MYSILSAKYANETNTAAILQTVESGAVLVSPERGELWEKFQEWLASNLCDAYTPPPFVDPADVDNLEKALKAMALVMRDYCNALKAGTYTTKTVLQLKADFKAAYQLLL